MNDEDLDYWDFELDLPDDDIHLSIYTLLPVSAVFISIVLILVVVFTTNGRENSALPGLADEASSSVPSAAGGSPNSSADRYQNKGIIAPFFTPSVQYWETEITAWASTWDIDPDLVATVMQIESCGHPDVVSSAGAMGLFQVMPFHFEAGEKAFDPATNASRGLSYLSRSMAAHEANIYYALAGYNGGITGSKRPESAWPAETKRYTYWGSGIFMDAQKNNISSERLDEWLASGGASLCNRATTHLGLTP